MKRIFAFLSISLVFVFFASSVYVRAEDGTSSGEPTKTNKPERVQVLKTEKEELNASREMELRNLKADFQKRKEDAMTEFKANLQKIKDTRKQTVVTNVNDRIGNRNTLWVSHWNEVTKRLTTILDKIQTRSTEAAASGKDVTSVTTAITAARSAISAAQAAIDTQSTKTYTIAISSETTLGSDVKATISAFQTDVKNVISLLNTARRAVETAFQAIKTVIGTEPTATPLATTQP